MDRGRGRLFPVGLYALLLVALCWAALPRLTAPAEKVLLAGAALPLRAYASVLGVRGEPVEAVVEREARALLELRDRQEAAALRGARPAVPAAFEPVHCRITERRGRGGGGLAAELLLDRTWREVEGCERFATVGGSLIGFLAERGIGPARDDGPDDPARLLLLHHPEAPRVAAALAVPGSGRHLRFVVEPAGEVDRWPLRGVLWSDPHVAAELEHNGLAVHTEALDQRVTPTAVPPGLVIGGSRIWGYRDLTIGIYVAPRPEPEAVTSVVLWHSGEPPAPRLRLAFAGAEVVPVRRLALPAPQGKRWFVAAPGSLLAEGAALVDGVRLVGRVRGFAGGQGMAAPFGEPGQRWSVMLMPDRVDLPPVSTDVRVLARRGARVVLAMPAGIPREEGLLFSGVNGTDCPAGLLLGRTRPGPEPGHWLLVLAGGDTARGQGVYRRQRRQP